MKLKKIAVPESALVVEGFTDYCPGFKTAHPIFIGGYA